MSDFTGKPDSVFFRFVSWNDCPKCKSVHRSVIGSHELSLRAKKLFGNFPYDLLHVDSNAHFFFYYLYSNTAQTIMTIKFIKVVNVGMKLLNGMKKNWITVNLCMSLTARMRQRESEKINKKYEGLENNIKRMLFRARMFFAFPIPHRFTRNRLI